MREDAAQGGCWMLPARNAACTSLYLGYHRVEMRMRARVLAMDRALYEYVAGINRTSTVPGGRTRQRPKVQLRG